MWISSFIKALFGEKWSHFVWLSVLYVFANTVFGSVQVCIRCHTSLSWFHNPIWYNMWWWEKGEEKVRQIFRVFWLLWKWKCNACFKWNHTAILQLYSFSLCHTSYLFCCWSSQPVLNVCLCKHYSKCNGKIKGRWVLSLQVSRGRDKLLTSSVPSQFCCIIRSSSVSLILDIIVFTLCTAKDWKNK